MINKKILKNYACMDKQTRRGRKENSDSEQKLANQNNSFPLCPIHFYLSTEAQFLRFFYLLFFWLYYVTHQLARITVYLNPCKNIRKREKKKLKYESLDLVMYLHRYILYLKNYPWKKLEGGESNFGKYVVLLQIFQKIIVLAKIGVRKINSLFF